MMQAPSRVPRRWFLLLALAVFGADQLSKKLVLEQMLPGETHTVIPGLFALTYLRNRGAAFGLLADFDSGWILGGLIALSALALALVGRWLWHGPATAASGGGLALILGGALGNLFDRLREGSVVDFLDFHLGPYHWPAFNLADAAIVVGAGILLYASLRDSRRLARTGRA